MIFPGCGKSVLPPSGPPASTGVSICTNGGVEISVGDDDLRDTCGCVEAAGTLYNPGTPLTCTVNIGTTVFFDFSETSLHHQLVPSSGSLFPAQSVSNPGGVLPAQAIQFSTAGSYGFQDAFNGQLTGTIVVH